MRIWLRPLLVISCLLCTMVWLLEAGERPLQHGAGVEPSRLQDAQPQADHTRRRHSIRQVKFFFNTLVKPR